MGKTTGTKKRAQRRVNRNFFELSDRETEKILEAAFNSGWCIWIKKGAWGNRRHISEELLKETFKEDREAVTASHMLIDHKAVRKVVNILDSVVIRLKNDRLITPLFDESFFFMTEDNRSEVVRRLDTAKDDLAVAVDELVNAFPELEKEFAKKHPKFYKKENYPIPEELRSRFRLRYIIKKLTLPMGKEEVKVVGKEVVESENKKYKDAIKDEIEKTLFILRKSFREVITYLRDVLKDPNKTFKDATVEKPKQFIEQLKLINMFGDKPFASLLKDVTDALDGVYAEDLRDDKEYRAAIADVMEDVVKEFEGLPVTKLQRDIDW